MEHRTKKDYAVALIRDLIVAGELDPGERVNQSNLADRLKISLTPVREALRQLEAEGLVASSAHHGVRVSSADHSSVTNVYVVRRRLEPYAAARGTVGLKPSECRVAADLLRRLNKASDRGDARAIRKANYDFHFLLYVRAHQPFLEQLIRMLWARFPWDVLSVVPGRMNSSRVEHEEILAAMEAADPQQVANAVDRHIAKSYSDIVGYLWPDQAAADPYFVDGPFLDMGVAAAVVEG